VVAAEFTCTDQFPNHDIGRGRPSWRDDHVDLPYSVRFLLHVSSHNTTYCASPAERAVEIPILMRQCGSRRPRAEFGTVLRYWVSTLARYSLRSVTTKPRWLYCTTTVSS